jgi:hypothetical protein
MGDEDYEGGFEDDDEDVFDDGHDDAVIEDE